MKQEHHYNELASVYSCNICGDVQIIMTGDGEQPPEDGCRNPDCPSNTNEPISEWHLAPKWAKWRTIDSDGIIIFWSEHVFPVMCRTGWGCERTIPNYQIDDHRMTCGIHPDRKQYENGAWKNSLMKRPGWAEKE